MIRKLIILLFLFYFIHYIAKASFAEVSINEFSSSTSNDDWVELYNNSESSVDLSQYTLHDGSTNTKKFSCVLMPKGLTVVGWNNSLNNLGDLIILKKENATVYCVSYGDGADKKCEGRNEIDLKKPESGEFGARSADGSGNWIITNISTKDGPNDGSQKNPNAVCVAPTTAVSLTDVPIATGFPSPTLTPEASLLLTPNASSQTYNNIFLSEVMIDPETGNSEWIEIYNDNNYEVILSNWYIDDTENSGTTPKQFSLTILPESYASYDLSSSMFNNDGDSVRLLDFNQLEIDSFQYQSSEKGKTLGRTAFDSDSFCQQNPTRDASNGPCISPTATPTPKSTASSATMLTPSNTLLKTPTIPTKTSSTVTPKKFSLFTQNQQSISDSPEETNNEVLGVATQNDPTIKSRARALLSSLSFASLAYPILSIISILIKLKMNS